MRKIIYFLICLLLITFIGACDDKPEETITYNVVLPGVSGGTISSSATTVKKGESVELIVSPNEYYELSYLKVNEETINVTFKSH